jgi:hypothetical protein
VNENLEMILINSVNRGLDFGFFEHLVANGGGKKFSQHIEF